MIKIQIKKGDITKMEVGAIVNAADESLEPGGGVSGAIHRAAGPKLAKQCEMLGGCETGEAKMTNGYELKADYVIHTVGPVWKGGDDNEPEKLASSYKSVLQIASNREIVSIAFPSIATGAFDYPTEKAAKVAFSAINEFVESNDTGHLRKIFFVLFSEEDYQIYQNAYQEII